MAKKRTMAEKAQLGSTQAAHFGALVRERRKALKMNQSDVALATGVGRRFIIDLEAGKPSTHLGKSLIVAEAVGLRVSDLLSENKANYALLPDMPAIQRAASAFPSKDLPRRTS